MQQQGAALDQAGSLLNKIRVEQIEQVNETKVNAALAEAQAAMVTYQRDYSQLRGANAMPDALDGQTLTAKYTGEFDRNIPEIALAHGLNDVQRQRFMARTQPLRSAFFEATSKYEAAQFDDYSKGVYETGVAAARENLVANWQDPALTSVAIATMADVTLNEARRQGLTEEAAAQVVAKNVGDAITTVVDANVANDPIAMRDLVDGMRGTILPSQAAAMDNKIGAQLDDIEGREFVAGLLAGQPKAPGEVGSGSSSPLPGVQVETTMPIAGGALPTSGQKDYGPRTAFRTSNGRMSSSNHDGVDFSAPAGTPVRAVAGGRVVRAGVNGGYGNFVEIEHADGSRTGYAHLQGFNVSVGDQLAPGQTLGAVGSTGNSTGPHLHLRYRDANGRSADPAQLFQNAGATGNGPAPQTGAGGMTRSEAIREANARFGNNPRRRAAAVAAINEHFNLQDMEEREAKESALDAAYAYIRDNNRMPPASMLVGLERNLGSLQSYYSNLNADPGRKTDEATMLSLLVDRTWKQMSPEEFVAKYGSSLSQGDLRSFMGQLGTAIENAGSATEVNHTAFGQAFTEVLGLAGVRDIPKDDTSIQAMTLLRTTTRDRVLAKQQSLGRQLNEMELRQEVSSALAQVEWVRPSGPMPWQNESRGFATSYQTMHPQIRDRTRREMREAGLRNPSDEDVFNYYVMQRLRLR